MRWVLIGLIILLLVAVGVAALLHQTGRGAVAHVDPATAIPKSTPNWALALPMESATKQFKTHDTPIFETSPAALMAALDKIALAEPRTTRARAGDDPLWRSYIQRSRFFRFPDYISVKAVAIETQAGPRASLIIYSRSVYGLSDLGVNAKRLERWLTQLRAVAPVSAPRPASD
ncbi:MAG: DUF1499 domain-containing protein [Neomegalonema sp.]|nr:DUF1499 domain-containing protein [Neomegalonema sp.]